MATRDDRSSTPKFHVAVQVNRGGPPTYCAMWRHTRPDGTKSLTKRAIGLAWVSKAPSGEWVKRRGRPAADYYDETAATVAAGAIVARVEAELTARERSSGDRDRSDATFREIASAFLDHREHVKGTRPSTLTDYRSMLAEPGVPLKRRLVRDENGKPVRDANGDPVHVVTVGWIMRRIGDKPAANVTTRQIEGILKELTDAGRGPTTVNKYRALMSAIYNYACRKSTFGLLANPVAEADRRRQPPQPDLEYYSLEEVEALARTLEDGKHRGHQREDLTADEIAQRRYEDRQAAELVRIVAYTGLRRGELVALRWGDVDFGTRQLHVRRAVSDGVEVDAPKSGKRRLVPLTDRAGGALARLAHRDAFTGPSDYVAVNERGQRIDVSALAQRVRKAQEKAGLRRLGLHGLRHSFASQLVARGLGLADVQKALGHAKIETTGRYLHARPANELADAFSRAQENAEERSPVPST